MDDAPPTSIGTEKIKTRAKREFAQVRGWLLIDASPVPNRAVAKAKRLPAHHSHGRSNSVERSWPAARSARYGNYALFSR